MRPAPGRIAAAWLLVLLLIGGTGAAGYLGRHDVVRLWPPAYQLYHVLGIPVEAPIVLQSVPAAGFDILDVIPEYRTEGGQVRLHVSGVLTNTTGRPLGVPPLIVTVLDAAGDAVSSEVVPVGTDAALGPGEVLPFSLPLAVPGPQADRLELTLRAS